MWETKIHTRKKTVISNQEINSRVMNNFRRIYDFWMYKVTLELCRVIIVAMETQQYVFVLLMYL